MKKILCIIFILALMSLSASAMHPAWFSVYIEDTLYVNEEYPAMVYNGRVYLPVKLLEEELQLDVYWNPYARHVMITNLEHIITKDIIIEPEY